MRPLYIDVNGTTDANGNASIPVTMPRMTGRWHNAKFTLGTTAPAEWAVLVNGRPYTYGRGRRVTLGPELIQDGQTATVSVIGGPTKATVDGTVTGVSGTPDEIMAVYTPAPNTIALDIAQGQQLLGTILTAGGGVAKSTTFPIPAGTQGVGFLVDQNGTHVNPTTSSGITMVGNVSAFPYITFGNAITVGQSFVELAGSTEFFASIDTSIICTVTDPNVGTPALVYFYAYAYNPKTRSDLSPQGSPVPVSLIKALLSQWPQNLVQISTGGIANGTAVAILGGAPSQQVYPHWLYLTGTVASAQSMQIQLRDTTNHFSVADLAAPSAVFNILNNGDFKGASSPIPIGAGLELFNITGGGAAITCMGWLAYSQG